MQSMAVNIAYATLLVFVFGALAWVRRPDDRARCWFAGWLMVLGTFIAQAVQSYASGWRRIAASDLAAGLMVLAAVYFVVSSAIPVRGRRFGIALWFGLSIPSLLCTALALLHLVSLWPLLVAVLARQVLAIAMISTMRRVRPVFGLALASVCVINAVLMVEFALHGRPELVVPAILTEMYMGAGLDVWNKQLGQTIGMRVTAIGLFGWAVSFPLAEFAHRIWPQIAISSDLWNPPKACVGVGMLLLVFEEQMFAARSLARDYKLLFDDNPNPLWIFSVEDLRFVMANDAACALHGYTREEFLKLRLPDILHPDNRADAIREATMPDPISNRASLHIRKNGSEFPMDVTVESVSFRGKPCRFVLGIDVTGREHLAQKLEFEMGHDPLTGLMNRRSFERQLGDAVASAITTHKKLAILTFDIDHFRRLNEVYGSDAGDECIRIVARVLSDRARPNDFVARTGDDEFAMVLTGLRDLAPAEEISAHLNESFSGMVSIGEYELPLSVDIGVGVYPDDGTDAMALWQVAKGVTHRAETMGGGRVIWLSPELRAQAEKIREIASGIGALIEDGCFRLVYQPLYGKDGHVCALEALLRLDHPQFGPVSPLTVIQTAEETGQIDQLGQWLFEQACRQVREWTDTGMRLVPVAINISARQMMREGFAERLAQTLYRNNVDPQWIHIEVTETAAMDNLQAVSSEMMLLSALGCRFSIDDFGTGHSSLGRLHRLPIAILKIDRSFIEQMCVPERDDAPSRIIQAILSMAHSLGLQVVAEGVETERQLNCLRHLGCDLFQGFLLSKPARPEAIPGLLGYAHPAFRHAPSSGGCFTTQVDSDENAPAHETGNVP